MGWRARLFAAGVLTTATLAAVLPTAASASFATILSLSQPDVGSVPTLVVVGESTSSPGDFNEPNGILVEDAGVNAFMVTDSRSPLQARGPCDPFRDSAWCSGSRIGDTRFYSIVTFDGNDSVQVRATYLSRGGRVHLGGGDDTYTQNVGGSSPPKDDVSGGAGLDTVSYRRPTATGQGVVVRTNSSLGDAPFDDGQGGTEDRIRSDVERVIGTELADTITAPNQSAPTHLFGLGGNDTLTGTPFDDSPIDAGAGVDTLNGGAGDDMLVGREEADEAAARDQLNCGTGLDTAILDLQDRSLGCENRQIAAIDEGGILSILSRNLRRGDDGRVKVRLRCPKSSKTRCRGRLRISKGGNKLGSKRYRIRKGRRKTVRVRIEDGVTGRLLVRANERDSKGRPKTTEKRLGLR